MNLWSSKNIVLGITLVLIFVGAFYVMGMNSKINEYPEGLKVEVLASGTGDTIQNGDTAVVHYVGTFDNGTVFDSSLTRGIPFSFTLGAGRVIRGWDIGVLGMRVGEKRRLVIDPELAYGSEQVGPIPAGSRLTFEVELIEIK